MSSLAKIREKQEKRKKLRKSLYWVVIAAIILYFFFGTKYNLTQYWRAKSTNKQLTENLVRFSRENQLLREQIEDLRNNPEAWERIAREHYGMQKKGERVIIFKDTDN